MIPELFRIGSFSISPFGPMLVAAFAVAYWELGRVLQRIEVGDREDAETIVFTAGLAGLLGAKLYYSLLHGDFMLFFSRSGLVWYGGFIGATLALIWVMRRRRLPAWPTTDAMALALALGYGVGRVGCFLVGDDYGMPTNLPWGVVFRHGLPGPTTAGEMRTYGADVPADVPDSELIPVHPTQLYETFAAVGIWLVGRWLLGKKPRAGVVALAVIAMLAVERFLVEFVRAKDDRFFHGFTTAQLISVSVLAVVAMLAYSRRSAPAEQ